ncbi:uncharacterized protein O3C94_002834 [Discoglossus pictus]
MSENENATAWIEWNSSTKISLVTGFCFFIINMACLLFTFVRLNKKIDDNVCKSCLKETIPIEVAIESRREEPPLRSQVTRTIEDTDSSSDESDSCEETTIQQKKELMAKSSLTYSTIQFNIKGQSADYENLSSDYVNVDPKQKRNHYGNVKDLHRLGGSVDYTDVAPAATSHRLPSHLPLITKESTSS